MAEPKVCIIELGGTIGDIEGMPFIEAFRQFQFRVGRENFCSVHVSWVPQPNATGDFLNAQRVELLFTNKTYTLSHYGLVCTIGGPTKGFCYGQLFY